MVKLYFLALVAVVLVLAPTDVAAVSNFQYKCNPGYVTVSFTPSKNHSGKVSITGARNSACSVSFAVNEHFTHNFDYAQCGGKDFQLMMVEVQTIVHGSSSSSSSSSSSQSIRC